MNPNSDIFIKSAKLLDFSILLILIFILIDFLAYDYKYIHLEKPVIPISNEMKHYFEFLPWLLFIALVLDLYLKYLIVGKNWDKFVKKYWLDILLTLLIPLMYPLKIIKASIKSYKLIKTTKYSFKIVQKLKKFNFFKK
ncbi:MAG: hypothetical protein MRJ93_15055 [Nitrososphaeraceae archaeon]|nr:hypothetical protein [Nitrososphaeraceae archaeon]